MNSLILWWQRIAWERKESPAEGINQQKGCLQGNGVGHTHWSCQSPGRQGSRRAKLFGPVAREASSCTPFTQRNQWDTSCKEYHNWWSLLDLEVWKDHSCQGKYSSLANKAEESRKTVAGTERVMLHDRLSVNSFLEPKRCKCRMHTHLWLICSGANAKDASVGASLGAHQERCVYCLFHSCIQLWTSCKTNPFLSSTVGPCTYWMSNLSIKTF